MNSALICALALISPHRPQSLIGSVRTEFNVYRDATKDYCFEETTIIGRTYWEDELLSSRETSWENCAEVAI